MTTGPRIATRRESAAVLAVALIVLVIGLAFAIGPTQPATTPPRATTPITVTAATAAPAVPAQIGEQP